MTDLDVDAPRELSTRLLDDLLAVAGSAAGGFALAWIGYENLLPTSGPLGLGVCAFVAFLLLYAAVSVGRHGRTVIADRLAAALVYAGAGLVGGVLLLVIGYTLYRGFDALRHT